MSYCKRHILNEKWQFPTSWTPDLKETAQMGRSSLRVYSYLWNIFTANKNNFFKKFLCSLFESWNHGMELMLPAVILLSILDCTLQNFFTAALIRLFFFPPADQTLFPEMETTWKVLRNLPTQLAHIFISVSGYSIVFTKIKLSAVKTQWKSWYTKSHFRNISTYFFSKRK